MQAERWRRVEELYHTAMEQEEAQRAAFLENSCAGDEALRVEVVSLIVYGRQGGRIIDKPAVEVVAAAMAEDLRAEGGMTADKMIGARIAQYRIVEKLGEGGMGDVYRAVRADEQFEKHVAIKLVRQGLDTEFVYARFRKERQILAGFWHENIARLLDGGTTEEGHPYFVMELVEGKPIDEYCDERKLGIVARIDLFLSVCSAVQYAHQRLVVHRDIKPSNVLVTADGVPKLLDFGIAAILNPESDSPTADPTVTAQRMMTPQFASPEQLRGEAITTATDAYSLGVVLYTLLTGRLPYRLDTDSPYDLAHAICEVEPEKPSTAVGHSGQMAERNGEARRASMEQVSNCRSTSPEKLCRELSGDLDQILLKALRKEPQRRYASAQDFAEDLRSYTLGLPVSARRGTFSYRSGKFIKRNKLSLAATAIFALVLLTGAVAIVREARIARIQQASAERRFETLRKLTNSLLFEFHDSIETLPGSTKARELVVSRALEYLDQIAAEAHNDQATLRDLAAGYERIGKIIGAEHFAHLGGAGAPQQAEGFFEKALAIRQRLVEANPSDLSLQLDQLRTLKMVETATFSLGDLDGALAFDQQRLRIEEQLAASHDSDDLRSETWQTLISLGISKTTVGDDSSAVDYERRALAMSQTLLEKNPANLRMRRRVAVSHDWLGKALMLDRKYAEAGSEFEKANAIWEQLAANDPNNTDFQRFLATTRETWCGCLAHAGLLAEARPHCQKTIAINEGMMKSDKNNVQAVEDVASSYDAMGFVLYLMHSPQGAMVFERRANALYTDATARDPDSLENGVSHARALMMYGRIETDLHRPELARENFQRAQGLLGHWAEHSPRDRYIRHSLDEVRAEIKALPNDTVPIIPEQ
jgi:non-specific serine/threonine protein kinase/serine/threonine-protein kinase